MFLITASIHAQERIRTNLSGWHEQPVKNAADAVIIPQSQIFFCETANRADSFAKYGSYSPVMSITRLDFSNDGKSGSHYPLSDSYTSGNSDFHHHIFALTHNNITGKSCVPTDLLQNSLIASNGANLNNLHSCYFGDIRCELTDNEESMESISGLDIVISSHGSNGTESHSPPQLNGNSGARNAIMLFGGVIQFDTAKKEIYLIFSGHEFADGGETISNTLLKHRCKASFFFTGDFFRNTKNANIINRLKNEGHYLGGHSDKHLLYASWEKRDSLLVGKEEFIEDIKNNYQTMATYGITPTASLYFLPPYEWYNQSIADWCSELGLHLINFTPGTSSNADYTTPEMPNYLSSDSIYHRILRFEENSKNGLNGFILLTHFGTDPRRTDKFYHKLDSLISVLKRRGYQFRRL